MRKFLAKHAAPTTGTLSCFDRLLFQELPLGYPHAMEVHLTLRKVLLKDWKGVCPQQSKRLQAHPYEFKVRRRAGRRGHRL
jgi:hypothetical protein